MNGVFEIGASGLRAQQRALDVVAHNIANLNTPAFKRAQPRFAQLVAPAEGAFGAEALNGVTSAGRVTDHQQGEIRQTGNPAHLAIDGMGFVELADEGGRTILWRGGALQTGSEGRLTGAGIPLKAAITVPLEAKAVEVAADGVVTARIGEVREELGRIELVRVKDLDRLKAGDGGLFRLDDAAEVFTVEPGEDGGGRFVQGALEGSNVELANEMVSLLLMQRAFAASAQVVQAGDQLMGIINGLKR